MLLGVAVGLWMIGNLYDVNSHIRHKMTVRVVALLLASLICWVGFGLAGESKYSLDWEPFSESRLTALLKQNKTVLVDFTADWCLNCHMNEYIALEHARDEGASRTSTELSLSRPISRSSRRKSRRWLLKFKQDGVPLTVIFPAGRENEPIVIDSTTRREHCWRV